MKIQKVIIKKFLLLLSISALFIGCANEPGKEVVETIYYASGKLGEIVVGELKDVIRYKYNIDGQITKTENSLFMDHKYEYNSDGKMVKWESYNEDGEIKRTTKYEYKKFDEQDNWIERVEFRGNKIESICKREITYY